MTAIGTIEADCLATTIRPRSSVRSTWTPTACKIMALKAVNMGLKLGLLFHILLGFK